MKKLAKITAFSLSSSTLIRTLTTSSSPLTPTSSFSLKNVTKSNFEQTLVDLAGHVRAADFVAVDLEMTGVTSSPWRESFEIDRYDVRYLKVKDSAEKFAVVQFGVCPFRWDPLKLSFVAQPHNFYIFPRQELAADGPSYEFLCQPTSIDFLARYQFDFNACIREGLSYLSRGQEHEALSRLASMYSMKRSNLEEVRDFPLTNISDVLFSERMKICLNEWRDALLRNRNADHQLSGKTADSKQRFETIFFNMRPALKLNGFTSYQLRMIELVTRKHFKDLVYVRAFNEEPILQKLIIYTESESDRRNLMEEVKDGLHQQGRRKIKEAVGFRHVIDLLCAEKKLIVGHNCFLDMAHMYHKFFGPLPSTAEEFVANIHDSFPHIVDTKILLNADLGLQKLMKRARTSLASAFSLLCPEIASKRSSDLGVHQCVKVEVQVDDMRSSNWNSGAKHEAGYDAFMTGCVFAQACRHLGVDFPAETLAHNEKLQKYVNLLYLSWNSGDVINVSTGSISELTSHSPKKRLLKISYPNLVLVWGFPSKLKASEIRECICKVFGPISVAGIYSLDETAVFVQFGKANFVSEFLELKKTLETNNNSITILHPLSKLLEGGRTCAAGYEVYKDICSSPISKVFFAEQAEAVGITWKTKLIESRAVPENPSLEQLTEKTLSSNPILENDEMDKWKKNVRNSTSKQRIFDNLLYALNS